MSLFPVNRIITVFLLILLFMANAGHTAGTRDPGKWLLVNTDKHTLLIMNGGQVERSYENISIGRGGARTNKRVRDGATPIGHYHITEITRKSSFHVFLRLDYPNAEDARRAYDEGRLDKRSYQRIIRAFRNGSPPPQNTSLGGLIGIHGLGQANPDIHGDFNWTRGCVALTNEQIDDLASRVWVGMTVIIR
jgi:murein L,D-transpeptidase YafK